MLPEIIASLIFGLGLGFSARDDDNFAIWKPAVLSIALFLACIGLGKLMGIIGYTTVNWVGLNLLLWAIGAALVKFILRTEWPVAVVTGLMFMVVENGFQFLFVKFFANQVV
ncbi:MAG: hypothetical protein ACI8UO_002738 [Verrucomicrobiales bacterium]|jgi:hypothetical protein